MKLSKKIMVAAAVGALGVASAVPAMALENEFHGMYRAYGLMTNALSGGATFNLNKNAGTDKYFEQRARLQYIAKASNDLKLVTQFELDTKFGGSTGSKYVSGDAGNLDADRVMLETKHVYLDFNIPTTKVNVKVGIQPWADSMNFIYGNFDSTGVVATTNFSALTAQYGYFTITPGGIAAPALGDNFDTNGYTKDLNVFELKYDINKNLKVGASYYMLLGKAGTTGSGATLVNNTVGLNAAGKFGPATVTANLGMQFGKSNANLTMSNVGTTALAASLAAKIAAGPGTINAAGMFLSGESGDAGYNKAWQSLSGAVNFYAPSNMYLLIRNLDTINSSSHIGSGLDITRGGMGMMGLFAGYEGAAGKMFYAGNVGAAKAANKQAADNANIGIELNATVGYKMYSNLSVSLTGAYGFLGDGYGKDTGVRLPSGSAAAYAYTTATVADAENPYMVRAGLNYAF